MRRHYEILTDVTALVLQEFRLHEPDTCGEAARIVASFDHGIEPAVPLLTSIDDGRDMATVRALHASESSEDSAQRAALDSLVATWQPLRRYRPRITECSKRRPTRYQLAVTDSGINNGAMAATEAVPLGPTVGAPSTPVSLLWTGLPIGTYAGLLLLLGTGGTGADPRAVPPSREVQSPRLSRSLGVRIYENRTES